MTPARTHPVSFAPPPAAPPAARYFAPPPFAGQSDYDGSWTRLAQVVAGIAPERLRVGLDIGDSRVATVDCAARTVTLSAAMAPDVDCRITTLPMTLLPIMDREMEPRYALMTARMTVDGPVALATRFCDLLYGHATESIDLDRSALPAPTTDLATAWRDLRGHGYAIVRDALPASQLAALRRRLDEQAAAERALGIAHMDGGPDGSPDQPNQRVWSLFNKGREFIDLLDHPLIDAIVPRFLGEYYLLSNYLANIANPGGVPMHMHTDQLLVQPPLRVAAGLNLFWFLDDVTEANGGTRLMPRSHARNVRPMDIYSIEGTIAAEGPAGSALLFDSRLWHATGPNRTDASRRAIISYFTRSWIRTYENAPLSILPDVLDSVSDRIKSMLGLRVTASSGRIDGWHSGGEGTIIDRDARCIPPLGLAPQGE